MNVKKTLGIVGSGLIGLAVGTVLGGVLVKQLDKVENEIEFKALGKVENVVFERVKEFMKNNKCNIYDLETQNFIEELGHCYKFDKKELEEKLLNQESGEELTDEQKQELRNELEEIEKDLENSINDIKDKEIEQK